MHTSQLEQVRSRLSENLTEQLRRAQAEVARTLARVRGVEEPADYPERRFSGVSPEQQAEIAQEKAEVQALEDRAQKEAGPVERRGAGWTTKRRMKGGP